VIRTQARHKRNPGRGSLVSMAMCLPLSIALPLPADCRRPAPLVMQ
jgi:hypothetical protein